MGIFTALPRAADDDAADAPAILRHILREPLNVVMVVLGKLADGEVVDDIPKILEVTIGRAMAAPQSRCVVLAPDPEVLEEETLRDIRKGSKFHVAATFGLRDTIAARLRIGEARDRAMVEDAYLAAEEQ